MEDGSVYSCGKNEFGQLGLGHSVKVSKSPTQVMGLPQIREIYCGDCNTFVISITGELWAWGLNSFGQLGIGTQENSFHPERVKEPAEIKSVIPGPEFTYILTTYGSINCFGRAIYLGLGYEADRDKGLCISIPKEHPFFDSEHKCSQIAAGSHHTLVLTLDGSLWGWGECTYGKLGNDTIILPPDAYHPIINGFETNPKMIKTNFTSPIVKIKAGSNHSMVLLSE